MQMFHIEIDWKPEKNYSDVIVKQLIDCCKRNHKTKWSHFTIISASLSDNDDIYKCSNARQINKLEKIKCTCCYK